MADPVTALLFAASKIGADLICWHNRFCSGRSGNCHLIGADFICWHYCFCFSRYSNCSSNGGVQDWCRFYLLAWSVFALDFKCVSVFQWRATSKTPDLSNSYSFFNSNLFLIPIKFLILNHFQFWFIFNSDLLIFNSDLTLNSELFVILNICNSGLFFNSDLCLILIYLWFWFILNLDTSLIQIYFNSL